MKAEIKAEWIAKLRSGEIEQGTGRLGYTDGKRCCLGVLCDIAVRNNIIAEPRINDGDALVYENDMSVLPMTVMKWADMADNAGYAPIPSQNAEGENDHGISLASLNDFGLTFDQIADIIEYFGEDL